MILLSGRTKQAPRLTTTFGPQVECLIRTALQFLYLEMWNIAFVCLQH